MWGLLCGVCCCDGDAVRRALSRSTSGAMDMSVTTPLSMSAMVSPAMPASASTSATALLIPEAPPVMMAVFPVGVSMCVSLSRRHDLEADRALFQLLHRLPGKIGGRVALDEATQMMRGMSITLVGERERLVKALRAPSLDPCHLIYR